ncbi:Ppx/GppA phosphatase family protein [Tenuifilum osseticum]|uniref:Ppx/GppA phosphatase family protein n=1 Tax=Tenuifilum osseticum TaxID=3374723 RepID=UPI0034E3F652
MIVAIIDMGTNTFNLLVAQTSGKILHESKLPVKLGEGGFRSGSLTPEAMQRAFKAINTHLITAKRLGANRCFAFATSAVRDASNRQEFVDEVKQRFNIDVEVIDGNREAELIWKGVNAAIGLGKSPAVVVDIGGGSNETILANSEQIFWLQSFNLGVTRIAEGFPISDPITPHELEAIESYMLQTVEPLLLAAANLNPRVMAGSSGAFDSFRKILVHKGIIHDTSKFSAEIPVDEYLKLHRFFVTSTHAQRLALPGLDPIRVDLIVPASIFVNLLVQKLDIKRMFQTDYALKEGFWVELSNKVKD